MVVQVKVNLAFLLMLTILDFLCGVFIMFMHIIRQTLLCRPKNHDYSSEKINHWTNDEIKQMFEDPSSGDSESHVVELMLSTKPMYACRGGFVYSYGKCTYNLMVEQTDKGFSKFYSILRFIVSYYL